MWISNQSTPIPYMLILSRKPGERIVINGNIIVEIRDVDIYSRVVRLGIIAPPEISIHREEVQKAIDKGEVRP